MLIIKASFLIKIYKNINLLNELFKSRRLYINDVNITNEYVRFIKPINEKEELKYNIKEQTKNLKFDEHYFPKRKDQYDFKIYGKLCSRGKKLYDYKKIKYNNKPLISVILPTFNKEFTLMKSLKSIQNQSLKNIEIIIVDDCSTDNTIKYYKNLLENDPRIRIFFHLKNLGVWRARIDGFLYSNSKYVIHFDPGDLYEDNYVLEDAYNIISKYNLDSIKMPSRFIFNYNNLSYNKFGIIIKEKYTKVAYQPYISNYNYHFFRKKGWIWNRLTRKNIISKSLYLLSDRMLNIYKNFMEDIWWNYLINKVSFSYLIIKRYAYLYFKDGNGEGDYKLKTEIQRDKMIQEFISFLYFDLELLPKDNNKKKIINKLHNFNNKKNKIKLNFFRTNFYILDNLLNLLIKDPFVLKEDKIFLNKLLLNSKKKQKIYK